MSSSICSTKVRCYVSFAKRCSGAKRGRSAALADWPFATLTAASTKVTATSPADRWRLDQAEEAYAVFDRQTAGKGVFLMQ
jgi:hypothetical protein